MGLMDETPGDLEISLCVEIMKALKNNVNLKMTTWTAEDEK
jgi:hypothetical protein